MGDEDAVNYWAVEYVYVKSHGPFSTEEETLSWIEDQPEPANTDTTFHIQPGYDFEEH